MKTMSKTKSGCGDIEVVLKSEKDKIIYKWSKWTDLTQDLSLKEKLTEKLEEIQKICKQKSLKGKEKIAFMYAHYVKVCKELGIITEQKYQEKMIFGLEMLAGFYDKENLETRFANSFLIPIVYPNGID